MKQKLYILGLTVALLLFAGVAFKMNHFPGAGIILTVGVFTLAMIFMPLALISSFRSEGDGSMRLLYIVTWITCFVVFTAMLFKIMHWPGAGKLLMVALPFPFVVFLPVYLYTTNRITGFSIYNTVFVLLLLGLMSVFNALLALNVSRTTLTDSLMLAASYDKAEIAVINPGPSTYYTATTFPEVVASSDRLLAMIDSCRNLILDRAGTTATQWKSDPASLRSPDSRQIVERVMLTGGDNSPAARLEESISNFSEALARQPETSGAASLVSELFEFETLSEQDMPWSYRVFGASYLSWTLVWFEELEMNIRLIRSALG
ncbi:MAG: hypothetical protein IH591_09730 [Bacteroidales bacterium]|nr:hypothetical protein [Bacteroidales bacterium]